MIEVKHLDKSFGDLHILKDISTNIEKGEKVVIIGPSGSGKSTFLRCLNRLEQPSGGQILFEGEDLTHMPDRQLYAVRQWDGCIPKMEKHTSSDGSPLCRRIGESIWANVW